jgi:hypothetical protein
MFEFDLVFIAYVLQINAINCILINHPILKMGRIFIIIINLIMILMIIVALIMLLYDLRMITLFFKNKTKNICLN